MAIWTNHGGGYAWRLGPASQPLTEDCFQQHPMQFADDQTVLQYNDGTPTVTIPAMTTATGTQPVNSQWRRNPIPSLEFPGFIGKPAFTPPCNGCQGSKSPVQVEGNKGLHFSLVDKVLVPDLPDGDYVLQWRWDTEDQAQQVWTNCADVKLGGAAPGPAPPSPTPGPTPDITGWQEIKGYNCFTDNGGFPIQGHDGIKPELPYASEAECQALCTATAGCKAFVTTSGLPGPCFLRSAIFVSKCLADQAYNLWTHGIPPPFDEQEGVLI